MVGCVHSNVKDRVTWRAVYAVMFRIEPRGGLCIQ
jgi:hypothetical protein